MITPSTFAVEYRQWCREHGVPMSVVDAGMQVIAESTLEDLQWYIAGGPVSVARGVTPPALHHAYGIPTSQDIRCAAGGAL